MSASGRWIVLGAALAALGVLLGAYGAHGLEKYLAGAGVSPEKIPERLEQFDTGVRYQMHHAIGLILVGMLASRVNSRGLAVAGTAFLIGIAVFSGLLYALVLTGVTSLGAIVPIGGVSYVVGWCALAWSARRWPHGSADEGR